jgi:hypothetical protein
LTYDAQDDGYLVKILVESDEIKVGQPLMITADNFSYKERQATLMMERQAIQTATTTATPTGQFISVLFYD